MLEILNRPSTIRQIAKEPPFRLLSKALIKKFSKNVRLKAEWDASARPHYLFGVLAGANRAVFEKERQISVIEFGVASGNGLLALQDIAAEVERETNVGISVFGFDSGKGLPNTGGDYRDHPERWMSGDFPMYQDALKAKLQSRTRLVLGDVAETVPEFVARGEYPPAGFVAFDLDFYTSTRDALRIFTLPGKKMLIHVPAYFDDITMLPAHQYAGELLAINEFNQQNENVKIDRWRGVEDDRPFPESYWLKRMFVVHDLQAASKLCLNRSPMSL